MSPLPLGVWEGLRYVIVALPGLISFLFFECKAKALQYKCQRKRTKSLLKIRQRYGFDEIKKKKYYQKLVSNMSYFYMVCLGPCVCHCHILFLPNRLTKPSKFIKLCPLWRFPISSLLDGYIGPDKRLDLPCTSTLPVYLNQRTVTILEVGSSNEIMLF